MMKARPLFVGVTRRNSTSASNPPAEAPIPTTQSGGCRLTLGGSARCTAARRAAGLDPLVRVTPMLLGPATQSASLRHLTLSRIILAIASAHRRASQHRGDRDAHSIQ